MSDKAVKKFVKRELRKHISISGMTKLIGETVVKGKIRSIIVDLDISLDQYLAETINFLCNDFEAFRLALSLKEQQADGYNFRLSIGEVDAHYAECLRLHLSVSYYLIEGEEIA